MSNEFINANDTISFFDSMIESDSKINIDTHLNMIEPFGSICYAGLDNSFVIDPSGNLKKCTVALDKPVNDIGKIKNNGECDIDEYKESLWITSMKLQDKCKDCTLVPICCNRTCSAPRAENPDNIKSGCPVDTTFIDNILIIKDKAIEMDNLYEGVI